MTCSVDDHNRLRALSEIEWNALEHGKDWDFGDEVLEQRHCPNCGSTVVRPKKGSVDVSVQ